jgi:hypothetical protein
MVSLMVTLGLAAVTTGRAKRIWGAIAALHMVCILLTASRWGLFCTLLVLPIFALRRHPIGRWVSLAPVVLVILFGATQAIPISQGISHESHSMEYRSWRWLHAVEAARAHPWTGEGVLPGFLKTGNALPPDGAYFALLRIGGWPALLAYLASLALFAAATVRLLRSSLPQSTRDLILSWSLGLLGLAVGGYLETLQGGPYFLLFLSMLFGLLLGIEIRVGHDSAGLRSERGASGKERSEEQASAARGVAWDGGSYRSTPRKK